MNSSSSSSTPIQQFQPANPVEMELVEATAVARWRLRRIWAIETSLFAHELGRRTEDMEDESSAIGSSGLQAGGAYLQAGRFRRQ